MTATITEPTADLFDADTEPTMTPEEAAEAALIEATEASLESVRADVAAAAAGAFSDELFAASALSFVAAAAAGVNDLTLANSIKQHLEELPKSARALAYSSPAGVGYHRRTGLVLSLDGDLPEDVTGRGVQTMIKQIKVKRVGNGKQFDAMILTSKDKADAVKMVTRLLKEQKREDDGKVDAEESAAKEPVVLTAMSLLSAARGPAHKAVNLDDVEWSPEAIDLATAMAKELLARVASIEISQDEITEDADQN